MKKEKYLFYLFIALALMVLGFSYRKSLAQDIGDLDNYGDWVQQDTYNQENTEPFGPNTGYGEDPTAGMTSEEIENYGKNDGNQPDGGEEPSGGETWNYLPGSSNFQRDASGTYYFAADDGTYRDKDGNSFSDNGGTEVSGGQEAQQAWQQDQDGHWYTPDSEGNKVYYAQDPKTGEETWWYKDVNTNKFYRTDENGNVIWSDQADVNFQSGNPAVTQRGTIQTDPSTGKISGYTVGGRTYPVSYNASGQPYYTLGSGQTLMLNSGTMGGVGSWLSNLFGGFNYNSRTGFSGGLGFGSTSGYGATTGGIMGGLFGGGTGGYIGSTSGGYYGGGATGMGGWNPANYISTGLPAGSIYAIIMNVAMWFLGVFGFIAIIGFIISGIMYLTTAGDEKQQEKAKKAMYYSITGVIVGLVGLVVIFAVHSLLQGASFF